jgi:hypothetical protein
VAALTGSQAFFVWRRQIFCRRLLLGLVFHLLLKVHSADMPLAETNLIPDDISLYTESMLWDKQLSISSGLGYKDNVLLSAFHRQDSGFFINGLDCLLIRLPLDGWEVESSIVGDDLRYWHEVSTSPANSTSSEDSFLGNLKVAREFPDGWKAGLEVLGAYEKQVLDISPPAGIPATALVEGEDLAVRPSLRKDLGSHWWLQLEMPVSRWWLAAPLDDYWEFGPVVTAGYKFGVRSDLAVSYGASYQDHNSWTNSLYADGLGAYTPAEKLQIFQSRVELAWHQYWDVHQRWRSSTQLVYADLKDNGGGFYNEYQYQVIESLRWQTADWMVRGVADITYEDYPVQWTGTFNNNTLDRDLWEFSAEAERRLYRGLRTFAKVDYQRCLSNEDENADNYHATTISAGLRYEF